MQFEKILKKRNNGITLVALVITVILLLILAGVSIATLTGSGLFEKAKLAEQQSTEKQKEEEATLKDYENKIGEYVYGTRQTTSKKDILWKAGETPTRDVQLNVNVKNYDFIIVYHQTANSSGDIMFDTSETATYITDYTYGSGYVLAEIKLDIDLNTVTMVASGSDPTGTGWNSLTAAHLTKIIGIKL